MKDAVPPLETLASSKKKVKSYKQMKEEVCKGKAARNVVMCLVSMCWKEEERKEKD